MSTIPVLDNSKSADDPFFVGAITNVRWADAESTMILCAVTFPKHPMGLTEPMPFTADLRDPEAHGQAIFHRCKSGEFGPIGDYVPPPDDMLDGRAQSIVADLLSRTQLQVDQYRDEVEAAEAGGATTLTAEQFAALQAYRSALRNLKKQPGYPRTIQWPANPLN